MSSSAKTRKEKEHLQEVMGLKWQAYGYKDMGYFAMKIMQKCGYLNYKYLLNDFQ